MSSSDSEQPPLNHPTGDTIGFVSLSGDDYAMGVALGARTASAVASFWDRFMGPRMVSHFGTPPPQQQRTYEWLRRNLEKVNPAMAAMIEGMGTSSGLGVERMYLMNHYGVLWPTEGLWCTSLAVETSDAGPVLAQNLDIGDSDFYFATRTQPTEGYGILSDRMLAMVWGCTGINEAGLAIGSSNLGKLRRQRPAPPREGIPNTMIPHTLLRRCATTAEAVAMAQSLPDVCPPVSGYQVNIVDALGERAVVDKCGPRTLVRQCTDRANFTTNCSLDEAFEAWRTDGVMDDPESCDARDRANHLVEKLAAQREDHPPLAWVEELFRNETLCRLGTNRIGSYSRLGLMYFPRTRRMRISNGPPSRHPYHTFDLPSRSLEGASA